MKVQVVGLRILLGSAGEHAHPTPAAQQVALGVGIGHTLPPATSKRVQRQLPALQVWLTEQRVPQLPQLRGSLVRSTQAPPHDTVPAGLAMQVPRWQRFLPCLALWQWPGWQR